MPVKELSSKISWPSRMSLPLSDEERHLVIDLKAILEKEGTTLKNFVWGAMVDRIKREHLLPLGERGNKK